MKGCREDDRICHVPSTQTRKCGNPFCGFTFAVSFEEIRFAKYAFLYHICPRCGCKDSEVVHMEFTIVRSGDNE